MTDEEISKPENRPELYKQWKRINPSVMARIAEIEQAHPCEDVVIEDEAANDLMEELSETQRYYASQGYESFEDMATEENQYIVECPSDSELDVSDVSETEAELTSDSE
ncbi:hypothetical protein KJ807_05610 [Patescibacteria group bacterium]|nr:hypothetical protein [Patescibacteria group bacterium]